MVMMADPIAKQDSVRVSALHALAYCPRLFYLEEVEEDSLLLVGMCDRCVQRIPSYNRPEAWQVQGDRFRVL